MSVTTDTATITLTRNFTGYPETFEGAVGLPGSTNSLDYRYGEFVFGPGDASATVTFKYLTPDTAYDASAYRFGDMASLSFRTPKSTGASPPQQGGPPARGAINTITVAATTATSITLQLSRAGAGTARTDRITYKGKANNAGRRPSLALTFAWKKGQATRLLTVRKLAAHDSYSFVWKSKGAVVGQVTATTS